MRLAEELGLDSQAQSDLYYALLLKDAGCSSNAAKICSLFRGDDFRLKRGVKTVEWTSLSPNFVWAVRNVAPESSLLGRAAALVRLGFKQGSQRDLFETRCERGADSARELGFPAQTAEAIRTLDEHGTDAVSRWDCAAMRFRCSGESSASPSRSTSSRSRTVSWPPTGWRPSDGERGSTPSSSRCSRRARVTRSGAASPRAKPTSWSASSKPVERVVHGDATGLDRVAGAFARVIDAKSPFTARHSERVAEIALGIGVVFGLSSPELRRLPRAALLHDIGKLGISNLILDKPGRLTDAERAEIERHPIPPASSSAACPRSGSSPTKRATITRSSTAAATRVGSAATS